MTTTGKELAVPPPTVNAEIVVPLTETEAIALDQRLRGAGEKAQTSINDYLNLIDQAIEGQIHLGLGKATIADYLDSLPPVVISDRKERKAFVTALAGKNFSQHMIAAFTHTPVSTVNRDVAEAVAAGTIPDGTVDGGTVISLDNKNHPKQSTPKADTPAVTDAKAAIAAKGKAGHRGQAKAIKQVLLALDAAGQALDAAFLGADSYDADMTRTKVTEAAQNMRQQWALIGKTLKAADAIGARARLAKTLPPKGTAAKKAAPATRQRRAKTVVVGAKATGVRTVSSDGPTTS